MLGIHQGATWAHHFSRGTAVLCVLPLSWLLVLGSGARAIETSAIAAEPTTAWVRDCFQEGLEKSGAKRRRQDFGNVILWNQDENVPYDERSRYALPTLQWIRLDPQDLAVRDGILEITVRPLRILSIQEQRETLGELKKLLRDSFALRRLPGGTAFSSREIEAFISTANVTFTEPLTQFRLEEVSEVQVAEAFASYLRHVEQNNTWRQDGIDLLQELKLFNASGLGFGRGFGFFSSADRDETIEVSWKWLIEARDVNQYRKYLPTITPAIRSDVTRARRSGATQRLSRFQQSILEAEEAYRERFRDSFARLVKNALTRFPTASGRPLLEPDEARKARVFPNGPDLPQDYRDVLEAGATATGVGQGGVEAPNSIRLGGMRLVKANVSPKSMTEVSGWNDAEPVSTDTGSSSEALIRFDDGGFGGGQITGIDFSADGRYLAVVGDVVRIWELVKGGQTELIIPYPADRPDPPRDLAFSPDAQQLILAMSDGLQVFDRAHPERPRYRMMMSGGGVRRVCISPSGRYLATAGDDRIVVIWDWPARRRLSAFEFQKPIESLVFADESNVVAVVQQSAEEVGIASLRYESGEGGLPDEFSLTDQILRAFQQGRMPQGSRIHPYAVSVQASYPAPLITCGGITEVGANQFKYWTSLHTAAEPDSASFDASGSGFSDRAERREALQNYGVSAVAISPDKRYVACADSTGDIVVRDVETFSIQHRFQGRRAWIFSVGFGDSREVWRIGRNPNRGAAWQRNQYAPLEQEFDFRNRTLRRITSEPAPSAVLQQGDDAVSYDLASGQLQVKQGGSPIATISLKDSRQTDVLWHSLIPHRLGGEGERGVVVGNEAGELILFDTQTLRPKRTFVGHGDRVWGAAIESSSLDETGRFLLSGSGDGIVRLWSLEGYRPRYSIGALVDGNDVVQYSYPDSGLELGDRVLKVGGVSLSAWLDDPRSLALPSGLVKVDVVRRGQNRSLDLNLIEVGDLVDPLLQGYFSQDSSEWVVWSRGGYYDASPEAHHLLRWIMPHRDLPGGQTMVAEQVRDRYHRPDVIDLILTLGNEEEAVRRANSMKPPRVADDASTQPVVSLESEQGSPVVAPNPAPQVELIEPASGALKQTQAASQRVLAKVVCYSDALPRLSVLVNNAIVPISATRIEGGDAGGQVVYEIDTIVELREGLNELVLIAEADGIRTSRTSAKATIERLGVDGKPTLYVLACGNDEYLPESGLESLRFAEADAVAIAEAFRKRMEQSGDEFWPYEDIVIKTLTNQQATLGGVKQAFDEVVNASKRGDRVILFFAMHGLLDGDRREDLWLVPHGGNPKSKSSTCLSWRELVGLAGENSSRDWVIFLDVCHSIALGGKDAAADRMLRADFSGIVYTACGPRQIDFSQERSAWGHGAFTVALLEALNEQEMVQPAWGNLRPDNNGDRVIDTDDLQRFLKDRVQQLTDGEQTPHYMRPGTVDFALF